MNTSRSAQEPLPANAAPPGAAHPGSILEVVLEPWNNLSLQAFLINSQRERRCKTPTLSKGFRTIPMEERRSVRELAGP
jgi:hypothetical protein